MGISWNYFKRYMINDDGFIEYLEGGTFGYVYGNSGLISEVLRRVGVDIPVYDVEPPSKDDLILVEPDKVREGCDIIISMLKKENNPILADGENLFLEEDLNRQDVQQLHDFVLEEIRPIRKLSEQGYFIATDFE